MAARRDNCSDDERDCRNARAGNIHTMSRCSRSWECAVASVSMGLLVVDGRAMSPEMPFKAPHIRSVFDWTGFYIGAHAGYSRGSSNAVLSDPARTATSNSLGGTIGGGHARSTQLGP